MSESKRCERCGGPLPQGGALTGRCPRCMLELGFESSVGTAEHSKSEDSVGVDQDSGVLPGPVIGRYRILRLIGEGGMGAVYEAEQDYPRRTVALKIIKPAMASPELLRRFEQESQALGRLQHPGIAQIYEAGTVDTGFGPQPYFAMELIRGVSPLTYAETKHLNTRERLQLMAKICEGVHHAHQRGLIHRDLKPGNILVDETGQPKILDFGVVRVTDSDARATLHTDAGQLVGTLAYMSPEQALADPLDIDTRSDVYALGVILYELLSGRLPYTISKKLHEAIQAIREEEPGRLSAVNRSYRGDIETIVAKAIEKDRGRRYASSAEMAADIQRYLNDEPIVARPQSAGYQLQKFARRHRPLVAGVAAVFVVLFGGIVVSTLQASRATRAERLAVSEQQKALVERDRANDNERAEAQARARETEQRQVAEDARVHADAQTLLAQQALSAAEVNLYSNNVSLADREWLASNIGNSDRLLNEAPVSLRNWEWNHLDRRNHMEAATLAGHQKAILTMALSADGKRLRTVSIDNTFKDWDLETRKEISSGTFGGTASGDFGRAMVLSANGQVLYSRTALDKYTVTVAHKFSDLFTGKEVFSFPSSTGTNTSSSLRADGPVALSPDGRRVVAAFDSGPQTQTRFFLRTWDIGTGRELPFSGELLGLLSGLAFSSDGSMLAIVMDASTTIVNGTTGQKSVALLNSQGINTLAFGGDGTRVIAGIRNGGVRAWNVLDGTELWSAASGGVARIAFSPDSRFAATALADQTIRLLDSETGREVARLTGHSGAIHGLGFTPNGAQLVSAGEDKLVHIWNLKPQTPPRILNVGRAEGLLKLSPDGDSLLTSTGSELKSWDTNTGLLEFEVPFSAARSHTDFSGSAGRLVALNNVLSTDSQGSAVPGALRVLAAGTGREIAVLRPPDLESIGDVIDSDFQISPAGDRAALVSYVKHWGGPAGSDVQIWSVLTRKPIARFHFDNVQAFSFRFSPSSTLAALLTHTEGDSRRGNGVELYDTTTGRRLLHIDVAEPGGLAFSPDSRRLVVASSRAITIWDAVTGLRLVSLPEVGATGTYIRSIVFSPDGTRLVSVSSDGEVWLWDANTGRALIPLRESSGPYAVREMKVSADYRGFSISVSYAGAGKTITYLEVSKEQSVSFSPDGGQIILVTHSRSLANGSIRIETWDGTPRTK